MASNYIYQEVGAGSGGGTLYLHNIEHINGNIKIISKTSTPYAYIEDVETDIPNIISCSFNTISVSHPKQLMASFFYNAGETEYIFYPLGINDVSLSFQAGDELTDIVTAY